MPSVSGKEHRAMEAAAHGISTLGIPKKVGQEFARADKGKTFDQATLAPNAAIAAGIIRSTKRKIEKEGENVLNAAPVADMLKLLGKKPAQDAVPIAAGIMYRDPDGNVLLLKRAATEPNYGGHWGLPGGKAEAGETADQAARRESVEEMGDHPDGERKLLREVDTPNGMKFSTFRQDVPAQWTPTLNSEHDEHMWADRASLPAPLHPQVAKLLSDEMGAKDEQVIGDSALTIAMDRDLVREKTRDGRLMVKRALITKAGVYPYRGEEIPGWETLGLDRNRVYNLLRAPEEIEKGMSTLNGVQLLKKHTPVSAQSPHQDKTVGSVGTDAEWDGENLYNSLFVNVQESIDGIESGKQRELSAGYHYKPDMTPGNFGGKHHDGVMRDLYFNHVALVEDGRVGPAASA